MEEKVYETLKHIQECVHELRRDVESLQGDSGVQIGNSTFDYMDTAINELKNVIKPEDSSEEPVEFGRFLKWARKRNKLTLNKLAELSGLSNGYLSQMETESRGPSPRTLRVIAPYLKVRYYKLLLKAEILNEEDLKEILEDVSQ